MIEKTKRRWRKFRLSTLVMLTLVIGALLGANASPLDSHTTKLDSTYYYYGWPFLWGGTYKGEWVKADSFIFRTGLDNYAGCFQGRFPLGAIPFLLLSVVTWVGIVVGTAYLSERFIRGGEARRAQQFWQVHFGAAVLLFFVGSALIWTNSRERAPVFLDGSDVAREVTQGWPFGFKWTFELGEQATGEFVRAKPKWSVAYGLLDAIIAIVICGSVVVLCEALIRRREGHKP